LLWAREAGVKLDLQDFDDISAKTPIIADLRPGGQFVAPDLETAGGMRLLSQRLMEAKLLHDCPTVSGKSMFAEANEAVETVDQKVVRRNDQPLKNHRWYRCATRNFGAGRVA